MSFRIVSCTELTQAQCSEIEVLQNAVYAEEGLQNTAWLSNEINFDRSIPCFFLGYEQDSLVSFLTLFMPTRQVGEVTAFTSIPHRGKGYFTGLLNEAKTVLRKNAVRELLFATEPVSAGGMEYLEKHLLEAVHSHTEWRMFRKPGLLPLPEDITVERVTAQSLEEYMEISLHEYSDRDAALAAVRSEQRAAYLLRDNGKPVGVFELVQGDALTLCGVAVARVLRGRGYGNMLVRAALNLAHEVGKNVELDVDSENPPALHLYRKYGFQPIFEVQYWRAKIE